MQSQESETNKNKVKKTFLLYRTIEDDTGNGFIMHIA